jgi:hypothetical protein
LDETINIPLGSVLTHHNGKSLQYTKPSETLTTIRKWNKLNDQTKATSLVLKFKIDVDEDDVMEAGEGVAREGREAGAGREGALLMAALQPSKTRFLNEINSKVKSKFGFLLNEEFLLKWCGLYGWDEVTLVSLVNHVLEEARQVSHKTDCHVTPLHCCHGVIRSSRQAHLTAKSRTETPPLRRRRQQSVIRWRET